MYAYMSGQPFIEGVPLPARLRLAPDEITVKLNDDRELKGRIIGTDPSTDLALIKIEGDDFPTIPVGDSDQLKVGEWVLAVGNPFNLNSTVTAGIVSAKARSIGSSASNGQAANIQSFIQTDAKVSRLCLSCRNLYGDD